MQVKKSETNPVVLDLTEDFFTKWTGTGWTLTEQKDKKKTFHSSQKCNRKYSLGG